MTNLSIFSKDLFTARHEFTRLFAEYLNDHQPPNKILYFHGSGGSGKTWLLNFLRDNCCKKFSKDTWQQIKAKRDSDLVADIQKARDWNYQPVPAVWLNFAQAAIIDDNPQSPFFGLVMLRRNLAKAAKELGYHLRFPFFDFACFLCLSRKGKSPKQIKEFLQSEEADLITAIVDSILDGVMPNGATIAKAILQLIEKHSGTDLQIWQKAKRLGLTKDDIREISTKDENGDLINELPHLFAKDLKAIMEKSNAPERIVLFFDSHDAFWVQNQHYFGDSRFFQKDEWLRRLLWALLDLKTPIVVVVAGQDKPRWAEATQTPISREYLDIQSVEDLSHSDASDYLHRVGSLDENLRDAFMDENLRNALIKFASVKANQVHPFFLSLCVDLVRDGKCRTPEDFSNLPSDEPKLKVLQEKLLNNVDSNIRYAVEVLSACRFFDLDLYLMLGKELGFQARETSFDLLTRFSFVQFQQLNHGYYRIHDLLRWLNYQIRNKTTSNAHKVLDQYYSRLDRSSEAIYHRVRWDRKEGWKKLIRIIRTQHNGNESENNTNQLNEWYLLEESQSLIEAFFEGRNIDDIEPTKIISMEDGHVSDE